ncbi:hypothetical protein Patl1_26565 [Pistacia atlantica]|uniref:Uncharacterized protein n=1 Tax=Pistacia atlantica TaxID=434234 RepID=A0ACC1B0I6_9ROSI|nr:hypothetical protein Patl1_26565 [Pistacia atlantica]
MLKSLCVLLQLVTLSGLFVAYLYNSSGQHTPSAPQYSGSGGLSHSQQQSHTAHFGTPSDRFNSGVGLFGDNATVNGFGVPRQ